MSTHDHELKIGSETKGLKLIRNEDGSVMYQVIEEIPEHQSQLRFSQTDWIGGHGQYDFLWPDKYFEGQSIDTTQDGRVILGPLIYSVGVSGNDLGANPVVFCWFEAITKLMVATATKVFWYDGTNFVEKKEISGKTITDMKVYNDILYVAIGSSDKWYTSSDGASFTQTNLTNAEATAIFASPNPEGTATELWSGKTPNKLYHTNDGTANGTALSSVWTVGDTTDNITNIFLSGDELMVGKTDNLFHVDEDGGTHPQMNDLKHNRSTNNFKYVVEWQGAMYFSLGLGLGEVMGKTFRPIGPLTNIDDIGKVSTGCVGLASDKDFLYVAIDEGTNTIIYKGREITRPTGLRWEWCPWVFLGTNACATMMVVQHTATDRRAWFGYGNNAGYVILSDDPTADSAARFAASGWIRLCYTMGTNRYWDKMWQSIITETKGCTGNLTVTPKYRKDTETSATNLVPSAIKNNGLIKTNFTNALSSKRIQFELHLATNDSSNTPEVLFFEARGVEKPETVRIHECVYEIGDKPSARAKTVRDFLRDGRASTSLMKFADLRYQGPQSKGTSGTDFVYVIMQPGYPEEIEIRHERGDSPELGIRVRLQEISFS